MNDREIEIHVKGGFSERKGIKHFSDIVQVDNLNMRTRNKLYGVTEELLKKDKKELELIEYIYTEIFSLTKNDIPIEGAEFNVFSGYYDKVKKELAREFIKLDYNEVFDFIEGIIMGIRLANQRKVYIDAINRVFIEENVNYRIVGNKITDIVNEEEINSIEKTIANPYEVVKKHYNKALEKLYKDKDYSNSIKESITSVEAMCQIINGSKETLGKALNSLKIDIHPDLKSAYSSIYGYTSDENGTRHANGIGEKNATFSEAKYMLISCSAFVNYLKENLKEGKEI